MESISRSHDTHVVDANGESLMKSFAHFNVPAFARTTGVWCVRIIYTDSRDPALPSAHLQTGQWLS
jgi:hypothetical protein